MGLGDVYRSFARVGELEPPTVAAIRGGAVGAGMNLAFATDLRVVAREAKLISGFLPIGLHAGGGHGVLLGRTGQREAAAALMLFGERIDGARAAELGLAWEAVDDDEVEERAFALASVPAGTPSWHGARALAAHRVGPPGLPWAAALELERASQMLVDAAQGPGGRRGLGGLPASLESHLQSRGPRARRRCPGVDPQPPAAADRSQAEGHDGACQGLADARASPAPNGMYAPRGCSRAASQRSGTNLSACS